MIKLQGGGGRERVSVTLAAYIPNRYASRTAPNGRFRMVTPVMPYQGSKRKIAQTILSHFPDGTGRVVEPFAGSAAVAVHALANARAATAWINDAHVPLMDLWRMIIHEPDRLADSYENLWNEQRGAEYEFYFEVRDRFNETHSPDDLLYLLARCAKAAVRFNRNGEFNNSPDRRRVGARPGEMRRRIREAHVILSGRVTATAGDYRRVMQGCTDSDLVYLDPPYQGTCGPHNRRYHGEFEHDSFCDSLEELESRGVPFILSYDGRNGDVRYGKAMPRTLRLRRITVHAGRSTQSTLLGRDTNTYESLYMSPDVGV